MTVVRASNLVALIAAAVLVGLPRIAAGQAAELRFKSGTFEPARPAPGFELQGSNGAPFKLSDARGKVVALAFGFTHCVRVCPTTLSTLARVKEKLGPDADKLQVVFVTVDPERDSIARLREFVSLFDASFLGLTGPNHELKAIREAYGITIDREPEEDARLGYQVHHSSSILLIDREGKLRLFAPFAKSAEDIVHDIKLLLR
jgi:protein SCO1/2